MSVELLYLQPSAFADAPSEGSLEYSKFFATYLYNFLHDPSTVPQIIQGRSAIRSNGF